MTVHERINQRVTLASAVRRYHRAIEATTPLRRQVDLEIRQRVYDRLSDAAYHLEYGSRITRRMVDALTGATWIS